MNLPTKLTLLRIVLTFLIMGLLFVPGPLAKMVALGLLVIACLTDWWDGRLARQRGEVTSLGAILDPIADKVLVIGLLLAFVQLGLVRAWMVLIIALREFIVTGVRFFAMGRGITLSAAPEGKHKAASQMVTIFVILCVVVIQDILGSAAHPTLQVWMGRSVLWCMWTTVILTVISGASFVWRHYTMLADGPRENAPPTPKEPGRPDVRSD